MELAEKVLLSRIEAAHLLSVSARTLDYMVSRGEISIVRIGHRVLIPRNAVERLAASARRRNPHKLHLGIASGQN